MANVHLFKYVSRGLNETLNNYLLQNNYLGTVFH